MNILFIGGVVEADVIINLPKPKTHRLAGITGAMKNMIGCNTMKEYLPHHSMGGPGRGDEYPKSGVIKSLQSFLQNRFASCDIQHSIQAKIWRDCLLTVNISNKVLCRATGKKDIVAGCWYGNDTIWRTIVDVNRIIRYADKNGVLQDRQQRKIFTIADMIVCGQGDGPLHPISFKMGVIVMGLDALAIDNVVAKLMGINSDKLPFL